MNEPERRCRWIVACRLESLSVTRHTRICSKNFEGGLRPTKVNRISEPHCGIVGNRKGTVIAFKLEKGVLQLSTMLSGKKEEDVKSYFLSPLKRRGKTKLILNAKKDLRLFISLTKGSLFAGFLLGDWNINGFLQHT